MEIERYIPQGREHAISRKELRALLGRDDRVIREWIKQANRRLEPEGKVILSSSSWGIGLAATRRRSPLISRSRGAGPGPRLETTSLSEGCWRGCGGRRSSG